MTTTPPRKTSRKNIPRIKLKNLVLGILVKEKSRILLMFVYLLVNSAAIYWLSAYLVERTAYQVYINPTIVLYVRIFIMSSPVIIGLLFGVPLLANEYESGTFQYLFTQGVGRRRLLWAIFGVYLLSIVSFSTMTVISVGHFLTLQRAAQSTAVNTARSLTIWSFGNFISHPIVIVPLTVTSFVAGVFFGALRKRLISGITISILFGIALVLGLQLSLEKILFFFAQRLYRSHENPFDAYNSLVASNDSRYLFRFQVGFALSLTIFSLILVLGSLRALNSGGFLPKKQWPS